MPSRSRAQTKGSKRKNIEKERWSSPPPKRARVQRKSPRKNYAESEDEAADDYYSCVARRDTPQPLEEPCLDLVGGMERVVVVEDGPEGAISILFKGLPIEIHQHIAKFLPTARDITKYAQVCKTASVAINNSVWNSRFKVEFDTCLGDKDTLAAVYKARVEIKNEFICFDLKQWGRISIKDTEVQLAKQEKCLQILKALILESNAQKGHDAEGNEVTIARNYEYIHNWVLQDGKSPYVDIVDSLMVTQTDWDHDTIVTAEKAGSLVLVIQLCLAPLVLNYDVIVNQINSFHHSQVEAYADHVKQPAFVGTWKNGINVRWLLSTLNFFAYHLKTPNGEGVLCHEYWGLNKEQLPHPWIGHLKDGTQKLGRHWKSAYTYMDPRDLVDFRTATQEDYSTLPVDEYEPIQDLSLFFDEAKFPSAEWPKTFESLIETNPYHDDGESTSPQAGRNLRSSTSPKAEPVQYPLKTFFGTSYASVATHYYGRIHGLPPQQGIPGFQRISFLRFEATKEGTFNDSQIWGYEGCVLPGGSVIIGRWWHINQEWDVDAIHRYSGPFIFWNVDDSAADSGISDNDAMKFLSALRDEGLGI